MAPQNPSITYWTRIEPSPRSSNIARALEAGVADPLWFLSRQWQLGEFKGEDAASPAWVEAGVVRSPLRARSVGGAWEALSPAVPAEVELLREGFDASDVILATELGQEFERRLVEEYDIVPADVVLLREEMPQLSEVVSPDDSSATGWLEVCNGRVSNGAFVIADEQGLEELVGGLQWASNEPKKILTCAKDMRVEVTDIWGPVSAITPPAWKEERLRYELELATELPGGTANRFEVHPGSDGEIDWYSLDEAGPTTGLPGAAPPQDLISVAMLPAHVRFRGMPARRFWDIESSETDFGKVDADTRDLARLVVLDFMLLQSNDWFLMPVDSPVGSLTATQFLVVHDVFGGLTSVPNANSTDPEWALFATTVNGSTQPAPYAVLAPTLGSARQRGDTIEDVRFLRDEMANMVWAIEHSTANAMGRPVLGHERSFTGFASTPAPPETPAAGAAPVRYQIQTEVPPHWIPFIPVQGAGLGEVVLEKGSMVVPSGPTYQPLQPLGRLLNPVGLSGRQRVREEEVPRSGAKVKRVFCRARGVDGSTHVWVERRRSVAQGESNSGLKFDQALPNPEEP